MSDRPPSPSGLRQQRMALVRSLGSKALFSVRSLGNPKPTTGPGFNLVRSLKPNGMGVYAALIDRALSSTGQRVQTLEFEESGTPPRVPQELWASTISAVTPGHIALAELQYLRAFSRAHSRAAVFAWDVDVIPRRLRAGFGLLDEIWASCSMTAEFLRDVTARPVVTVPTPIPAPEDGPKGDFRRRFGLQDKFIVSYQFDMGSSARRKNPGAAIEIYKAAFPTETGETHLVLKCTRTDTSAHEWRMLETAKGSRSDISLISDFWEKELVESMFRDIDCYLSPHRSEGYGLTIAEAVSHGVHVIATAHGGPLDFLDPEHSDLIPCRLVNVGRDPIYPERARWAEPIIDDAADLLRDAFAHRERTRERASEARAQAVSRFTLEQTSEWIVDRLS